MHAGGGVDGGRALQFAAKKSIEMKLTVVAAIVVALGAGVILTIFYLSDPRRQVERVTGWHVPKDAQLESDEASGGMFGGHRRLEFSLAERPEILGCADLRLPALPGTASSDSAETQRQTCRLEGAIGSQPGAVFQIEASRGRLVVQWVYL